MQILFSFFCRPNLSRIRAAKRRLAIFYNLDKILCNLFSYQKYRLPCYSFFLTTKRLIQQRSLSIENTSKQCAFMFNG